MRDPEKTRFDEDQVRAVLTRAIEFDARGPMTSVEDLRAIAGELGVSQAALDAALRERDDRASRHRSFGRAATAVAGLGLPLGAAAGFALSTMPFAQIPLVLTGVGAAALVASGAILVLLRSGATLRSFGLRNLALWGGYAAGGLAAVAVFGGQSAFELPWMFPLSNAVRGFASTMVLGTAAVLAIRGVVSDNAVDDGATPNGSLLQRAKRVMLRAARRIFENVGAVKRDVAARVVGRAAAAGAAAGD